MPSPRRFPQGRLLSAKGRNPSCVQNTSSCLTLLDRAHFSRGLRFVLVNRRATESAACLPFGKHIDEAYLPASSKLSMFPAHFRDCTFNFQGSFAVLSLAFQPNQLTAMQSRSYPANSNGQSHPVVTLRTKFDPVLLFPPQAHTYMEHPPIPPTGKGHG